MDLLEKILEYEDERLCEHEAEILHEYKTALMANDTEKMEWISKLGPTVRHRVMNIDKYRVNLMFGYDSIELSHYDWIESPELLNVEEISFKVKEDKASYNHIDIGHGLNGKWSYGFSYNTQHGSGGGCGLSTDRILCFDSREECMIAALDFMKYRLSTSGCNSTYTQKVIALVDAEKMKYSDLKFDKKGQVLLF